MWSCLMNAEVSKIKLKGEFKELALAARRAKPAVAAARPGLMAIGWGSRVGFPALACQRNFGVANF